jgi:hypothetical protein
MKAMAETSTMNQIIDGAREGVESIREYLASPEGQRLRGRLATALIFAAPAVARLPWFRATPLGRFVSLAGGAALVVKVAEMIRDWQPEIARPEFTP